MGGLFGGGPKAPDPPKPVETPVTQKVDQSLIDREMADKLKKRRGRAATVLAGDAQPDAASVSAKQLLGQ